MPRKQQPKAATPASDATPTAGRLAVEIRKVDPRGLKARPKNARYMTAEQMRRLTHNIQADGVVTSTVLLYHPDPDAAPEILSGHHRVEAAIAAGIEELDAHVITTELTEERKSAIQLSHNAITGQDDMAVLRELYEGLPLGDKLYSGLVDDDVRAFDGLDATSLGVNVLQYYELSLQFLPDDLDEFHKARDRIEAAAKRKDAPIFHLARMDDFDLLFDSIVRVKETRNVHNSAIALHLMATLALERLDQLEAEQANAE